MSRTSIPKEDLPEVLEKFELLAQRELPVADGLPVRVKMVVSYYADITGRSIIYQGRPCLIGFFRDITERRRAQEALRQEKEVLKQLLAASDQERQMIAYEIHDVLAQKIAAARMHFEVFASIVTGKAAEAQRAQAETARLLDDSMTEVRRLIGGLRPPILDERGVVAAIEHFAHDSRNHAGVQIEFHSDVDFERLEPTLENTLLRIVQEGVYNARRHGRSDRVRIELLQTEEATPA